MKQFNIFLTCLTAEYHKQLPAEFLNLGYTVSSAYSDKSFYRTNGIVSIISYKIEHDIKSVPDVRSDIQTCFNNIKGYFYSAVIMGNDLSNGITVGNIDGDTDISRVLQMKALW